MNELSEDYLTLKKRICEIVSNFDFKSELGNSLEPDDNLGGKQQDMIRAMVVLSHAEFESYFENKAEKLIEHGEEVFNEKMLANKNLASLFLCTDISEKYKKEDISNLCKRVIKIYKNNVIEKNQGIKRKNIQGMFTPLGYCDIDLDETLMNELDSFGYDRGFMAHNGAAKAKKLLDYDVQKGKILHILEEIGEFDKTIEDNKGVIKDGASI